MVNSRRLVLYEQANPQLAYLLKIVALARLTHDSRFIPFLIAT
jgi:hypothetical protein